MQLEYSTYSNQNMIDICLNTYGSINYLGKLLKDNGITNPLYNPVNNLKFVFDTTLIQDVIVYNQRKIYTTNELVNQIELMERTKRLTFIIGTDKPNGNTVQDDLLKQADILLIFIGGTEINEHAAGFAGYTFNKSTGTLDFTNLGGISSTVLDILYNSAS